ncbi:MAG TPA: hypothetical protein VF463_19115 [Sphingobium sp.]
MAMHQLPASAGHVTCAVSIMDERGRMQPQWHLGSDAVALLTDCTASPPSLDRCPRTHILTGEALLTYDQTDMRVAQLLAIREDAFLEHESQCMRWGQKYGAGPDVHQMIARAVTVIGRV